MNDMTRPAFLKEDQQPWCMFCGAHAGVGQSWQCTPRCTMRQPTYFHSRTSRRSGQARETDFRENRRSVLPSVGRDSPRIISWLPREYTKSRRSEGFPSGLNHTHLEALTWEISHLWNVRLRQSGRLHGQAGQDQDMGRQDRVTTH